ncbi:hypothetical protein ACOMHN_063728 [Nucella lapillus]
MDTGNRCAVLHGIGDLRVEEHSIPQPAADEVQIQIRSVGLCGSDLALYSTAHVGKFPLQHPIILGHEPCGVVSGLGSGVTQLNIGDRVALSPHQGCGTCRVCQEGRYNLCPQAQMMATPPTDGSLANFVVWPARLCYRMPAQMTWEEGALVQPMALALYGCQRAGVKKGHRVLVCGAGPMGMGMVMAAKAIGASCLCVTDISEERLKFLSDASGCLATRADAGTPSEVARQVTSLLGEEADVSIECSGAPSAVSTAIHATTAGGCILLAGIGPPEVTIPLLTAATKEVDIRSMFRFTDTYAAAIDLIAARTVDVTALVTHTFELDDVVKAFDTMGRREPGKVVIKCSDD